MWIILPNFKHIMKKKSIAELEKELVLIKKQYKDETKINKQLKAATNTATNPATKTTLLTRKKPILYTKN